MIRIIRNIQYIVYQYDRQIKTIFILKNVGKFVKNIYYNKTQIYLHF